MHGTHLYSKMIALKKKNEKNEKNKIKWNQNQHGECMVWKWMNIKTLNVPCELHSCEKF